MTATQAEYEYKLNLYKKFNNELSSGISQGLSLYNPEYDQTLYKNLDEIPKPIIQEKPKKKEEDPNPLIQFFKNFHSPFIGGDIGEDLVNYYYKEDDNEPFQSKTIDFYGAPIKKLYKTYTSEFYTILAAAFIALVIYKKI